MEAVDTLTKYGQSYQSKVVASLISDVKFLEQVTEITKPAFFESQANQWIISEVQSYFNEFRAVPTMEVFKIKVGEIEDKVLKQTVVEQLKSVYLQVGSEDLPYVKKEYLTFAKNQKVKDALLKSVDLLKAGNYDKIIDTMMAASKVGVENDLGLDYIDNFELIMEDVKRNSVSTGWDVIDELMDGGLGPGELGVVMAPSGIGKSWFLSKIACSAVQAGMNVLHYTLELSESYVGQRYTTILTGIQTSEHKERKEEIIRKIKNTPGRVRIKYYPPQFASAKTLSAHIEKLRASGFNPNLIIIDYADLLKSGSNRDGLYAELGGIYEELRGLSGETGIPIWTATQTNRAAIDHEVIQADSVGDSYKKVQTADFIMSVSRKTKDKLSNTGRIHIVKNRFGPDGMTFPAKIDTFHGVMDVFAATSADGIIAQKESKNGENLEKKLLHKKYVENMG
jgi:DnaB-like helicase C terminal domain